MSGQLGRLLGSLLLLSMSSAGYTAEPEAARVEVIANKAPVVKKIDKTVYELSQFVAIDNMSVQDILRNLPDLNISAEGKMTVKGGTQVTVLVDGKPLAALTGEERAVALQTMSAAELARVEVITNPSAAYAANGGAIVNLVLQRDRKPGQHAQFRASMSDHALWQTHLTADRTQRELSLHGTLSFREDGNLKQRYSMVHWRNPVNGQSGTNEQRSEVFVHRQVLSGSAGVDYLPNNADTLSISTHYNHRQSRPVLDVLKQDATQAQDTVFHRISVGPNTQTDADVSLSYSQQGANRALKLAAQQSYTDGLIDKSYRDVYVQPQRPEQQSHGNTNNRRSLSQLSVDWSYREDGVQWGAGLDWHRQTDRLANWQADTDPYSGKETLRTDVSNAYLVRTDVLAAYLTTQLQLADWGLLLGVRAEQPTTLVQSGEFEASPSRQLAVNPSLHMRYALDEKRELSFSVSRSSQRPDPRDLNPYSSYVDAQNLTRGNSALQPQQVQMWELGGQTEEERWQSSFSVFYRSSRNTVVDARSFTDNVLITSKQNGGNARSAGMTVTLDSTLSPHWKLGLDAAIYHVWLNTPDGNNMVLQSADSGYLKLSATYQAGADSIALDASYTAAGLSALGGYGARSAVNLNWKHQISKKLHLTLNLSDFFDGSKNAYWTRSSYFDQRAWDHFVARRLTIGLVRKFG
ncbi:TonB-dependent receptor [Undibacterium squillarum]|uniref:TonB-dependent receptor n=1 Tax=Undibacterium squillarum TaxID=1131567 RepID=A0ABQ2XT33_9BURK|nr:outer membrane beta-barrel family protein [Undibacterium squillarum]GGX32959.1 TonB-dependent receptor [Undibacterium squillarum]